MKRPYALICGVVSIPGACVGNLRKMHFAGLGDGNVEIQHEHEHRLRGAGNNNNNNKRKRKGATLFGITPSHTFLHGDQIDNVHQSPRVIDDEEEVSLDDVDMIDALRKKGRRTSALTQLLEARQDPLRHDRVDQHLAAASSDGPWQLSVLMLFGIIGVLFGLFVHFSTDPTGAHHFRRRMKKNNKHYFHSPSYKKKTDEWSEDEEVTEDDNYRGDTEGCAVDEIIATKKRISPVPLSPSVDPTADLYYNSADSFRQQESRFRKQSPGGRNKVDSSLAIFHSPSRPRSTVSSGIGNNTNNNRNNFGIDKASSFPQPPPFDTDRSGIGSGLEGFIDASRLSSGVDRNNIVNRPHASPLVKPMGTFTPTESFASMSSGGDDEQQQQRKVVHDTPPKNKNKIIGDVIFNTTPEDGAPSSAIFSSPTWHAGDNNNQYTHDELAELPTPRVDHTKGKRDLSHMMKYKISGVPLAPSLSADAADGPLNYRDDAQLLKRGRKNNAGVNNNPMNTKELNLADAFPDMPLVPNLSQDKANDDDVGGIPVKDAPRSVLLEELQLVRMESGVSGPKWRTTVDKSASSIEKQKRQQEVENMKKLRESASELEPQDDPRNSIQHIRKDLTISSDASSSLSSKISFSELKLEDVIGGGGFGQVWRANWKGTPVAVKVLTGSAQAQTVPKAVLEEFIAEINMVSGMRHPNIICFMGACLDPPNRAIVTELCENGSLWDALRTPLKAYQVADGKSRKAWPLDIYGLTTPPPTFQGGQYVLSKIEPPIVPAGTWPWALVKRVASGTARGMCYLHSGNPPVLHRDLKSANILLDESYSAKLADFGLSRLKATQSGMTGNCGTVQWMAPEVLCNEDYAEPADVFSFGIILWEMLTKECPYDGMTPIQCALAVLNENKRPEIPEWCPQSLRALIKNCVEKDPHSRPTFSQILATLDTLP